MGRSSREQAEQTRLHIIDAAMRLFSRNGFANTSIENIASEVGLTRGAVYGHFRNKMDLYEELMVFSQEPLYTLMDRVHAADDGALTSLKRFMLEWLDLLRTNARHRDAFEILLNKTELTEDMGDYLKIEYRLTREMIAGMTRLIQQAVDEGDLPKTTDPAMQGLSCYCYLMGVTHTWLFNPRLFPLDKMAEPMVASFLTTLHEAAAVTS